MKVIRYFSKISFSGILRIDIRLGWRGNRLERSDSLW